MSTTARSLTHPLSTLLSPQQGTHAPYNVANGPSYHTHNTMGMSGGGGMGGFNPYQNGMGDGGWWMRVDEEMSAEEIARAGYDPNAVIGV